MKPRTETAEHYNLHAVFVILKPGAMRAAQADLTINRTQLTSSPLERDSLPYLLQSLKQTRVSVSIITTSSQIGLQSHRLDLTGKLHALALIDLPHTPAMRMDRLLIEQG